MSLNFVQHTPLIFWKAAAHVGEQVYKWAANVQGHSEIKHPEVQLFSWQNGGLLAN
jgi:hypothetical protein